MPSIEVQYQSHSELK